ncbi:MAG: HTTM domain-containing protein [Flammeovirgaceae bacterium]|nr:HTTM domain-containing protein [Flammeovirgaceae bacterium]
MITQEIISSVALLFARISLCLIYFLSGYDKLMSSAWRSGTAIHSIINLDYFYNPTFIFSASNTLFMLMGWSVIIFEISFSLLIWFKKLRVLFLLTGILFHLGIIVLLGFPDFGLVMIICYAVFLPIKDVSKG